MVYVFDSGMAQTYPETVPDTTPVFNAVSAQVDDRDVYLEIGEIADDIPFSEAQHVADADWLEQQRDRLYDAVRQGEKTTIPLTNDQSQLRGFGGGMLPVVSYGDGCQAVVPVRRDDGPITHKLQLDINAGRTMYPAVGESPLKLMAREGAEEAQFLWPDNGEYVLGMPVYGDGRIDEQAQHGALSEFVGAARDPESPLHTEQFRTMTYEVDMVPPDNAARVEIDVDGDLTTFDAGIAFEPETSSIETFLYQVIDASDLPDAFFTVDTEHMENDGVYEHFGRESGTITVPDGEVTLYNGDAPLDRQEEVATRTDVNGLTTQMDDDFYEMQQNWPDASFYRDEPADHFGQYYATGKFRQLIDPVAWPFETDISELAPLRQPRRHD